MTSADHPRIEINPKIMVGKPVVRGTRLTVEWVIGLLAGGWTNERILENYPQLTRDDIQACLAYAHDVLVSQRPRIAAE